MSDWFGLQAPARDTLFGMHPAIAQHLPALASICERYKVRQLEVFGSAARATDFRADSDADFLIEFAPEAAADLRRFFGFKEEVEKLLGRSVDLVETDAVRNPYLLAEINRDRQRIYGGV